MANNIYIIAYQGTKAAEVKEAIKPMGAWFNHFENQFLVSSEWSMAQIMEALNRVVIQKQDRLLILRVDVRERTGWLNQQGWDWINKQLPGLEKLPF